jgi:hypothetical protein
MVQVTASTYMLPSRVRLGPYLTGWLDSLAVKPTTLDNYRTLAEVHVIPRLGGVALTELSAEQVDALYRELEQRGKRAGPCRTAGVTCKAQQCRPDRHDGLSPESVRHVHTMLRKALWPRQAAARTAPTPCRSTRGRSCGGCRRRPRSTARSRRRTGRTTEAPPDRSSRGIAGSTLPWIGTRARRPPFAVSIILDPNVLVPE